MEGDFTVVSPTTCGRRGGSEVEKEVGEKCRDGDGGSRDATHLVENSVGGGRLDVPARNFWGTKTFFVCSYRLEKFRDMKKLGKI